MPIITLKQINTKTDPQITVRAGRDISAGEHLSTMYTHSMWGTHCRRDHLYQTKRFWCQCKRCTDPTELGESGVNENTDKK